MFNTMEFNTMHSRIAHLAVAGLIGGLSVAACGGGGDDGVTSIDLADGLPSAAVCNGEPSDVSPPPTAPFSGYTYLSDGDGWTTGFDVFGEQRAIVGDDATSILCVTVVEQSETERCEYEEDGQSFTLVMASAVYDIELRNATTANAIARDTWEVPAEECPFITQWQEGETERTNWPAPSEEQIEFSLGPFLD